MGDYYETNGLKVYEFDASQLGVYAQPTADGNFYPQSPDDVVANAGADAALDGNMFDTCDGQSYAASQCARPVFSVLDLTRDISVTGTHPFEGITISIINGSAVVMDNTTVENVSGSNGTTVSVQLYPTLVRNGQVAVSNSGTNATAEQRAALAVLSPTRLAFVIGAMDMVSFARAIQSLGATDAGYTDGGGSTSLVVGDTIHGASEHRRVATWLVAVPTLAASGGSILVALGVAAAAAVGVYVWMKPRGMKAKRRT